MKSEREDAAGGHRYRRPGKGGAVATLAFVIWIGVIAWMAVVLEAGDGGVEGGFLNWMGRAHLLVLHFPIGMLFLVVALEVLRFFRLIRVNDEATIIATLALTFAGAIVASILGFLLMTTESFAGKAMTLHMWTGLAVVVLTFATLKFRLSNLTSVYYYGALVLAAVFVSAAGHYGGSMVHGADYFTEYAPAPIKRVIAPDSVADSGDGQAGGEGGSVAGVAPEDENVYLDYVRPILEAKCNECHNEDKIKGDLRMDTYELLMAGSEGSSYPTVVPGDPDESELIFRITLPEDDGDFMPPDGPALTESEIAILKLWIGAGAKRETTVSEIGEAGAGVF
ncbi:MAG: c-type cytochrome domain-containing protein [Verrucomicrobiota bacterium]